MSSDSVHSNERSANDRHGRFLRLYTKHQHRILAYLYTLVPNRADAEDLFQETAVLLWEKFDQFEPGSDFVAWACRVAFLKASNHRKRLARSKLLFSDDVLQTERPGVHGWLLILGMSTIPALLRAFAPRIRFYSAARERVDC